METFVGDIWDLTDTHAICIPINLGWKSNGMNVMGRGLAAQVRNRYKSIPYFVGSKLQERQMKFHRGTTDVSINQDPPIISIQMAKDGVD